MSALATEALSTDEIVKLARKTGGGLQQRRLGADASDARLRFPL